MLWSDFNGFGSFRDPWQEFERLNRTFSRAAAGQTRDFPAVNVWSSADNAVVTTEIPGIDPKQVDIAVVDKTMTLRGSRQPEELKEGESFHRRERWHGQFSRTFDLPFKVDPDKVNARFAKGIIYITLPRAEEEKPKKITITAE